MELTITTGIVAIIVILLTFLLYLSQKPLNRIKKLDEIGFGEYGPFKSAKANCELKSRLRRIGKTPPPYPNGWFGICESRDLKPGQARHVECLGLQLAVFRSESGEVHVIDAYCPHLGANLAIGGRVKGNCLQCPFHGWSFEGSTGKCVEIPYLNQPNPAIPGSGRSGGKIPDAARVQSHRCVEKNNHIYVWFHCDGIPPTWEVPDCVGLDNMTYRGRTEHWVSSHIEDLPENGSDWPHLAFVHRPLFFRGTNLKALNQSFNAPETGHFFTGSWKHLPAPDNHIGVLTANHEIKFLGCRIPGSTLETQANQIGPGIVFLMFEMGIFGPCAMIHHVLPVGPNLIRVQQHWYTTSRIPQPFAKAMFMVDAIQMERDIVVWNHKTYASRPVLIKEDTMIQQHRRFYSQFYSENSQRYAEESQKKEFDPNDW